MILPNSQILFALEKSQSPLGEMDKDFVSLEYFCQDFECSHTTEVIRYLLKRMCSFNKRGTSNKQCLGLGVGYFRQTRVVL